MKIKIGFEVETGKEAFVPLAHQIVTGVTQLSGKTTTLEALIDRSKLRAIVFKTKVGEKSFSSGTVIAPFFRDRSDYEFVKSLMEAYNKEKLSIERGTLMTLCKGSKDLIEIKRRVDEKLNPVQVEGKKVKEPTGIMLEIYTRLQHYLENLIPQIKYANFSAILNLVDGINIMQLEQFSEEAQSLIIQSTADEVLKKEHGVIIVIPEAWKFIPQKYNNPCKRSVEAIIRQGATNNNYVWIDSQDMSGVDKIPLKSISTWILGYQSERNEVKHTLDQISLPKKLKPSEDAIMTLRKGHFFISSYDGVQKVYVQPKWMDDQTAWEISLGNIDVDKISTPIAEIRGYDGEVPYRKRPEIESLAVPGGIIKAGMTADEKEWIRKELNEIRTDFFTKVQEVYELVRGINQNILNLQSAVPVDNTDEIVGKVLQKMPINPPAPLQEQRGDVNIDEIVKLVLSRVPAGGEKVYQVAPLEVIKKEFLKEAKEYVLGIIGKLDNDQKKILKFVEAQDKGCNLSFIIEKCLYKSATSGGTRDVVAKKTTEMASLETIKRDKNAICYKNLKGLISSYLSAHEATEAEIQQVYNHILAEML